MAYENSVLSLSPDGQRLRAAESVFRENKFEVVSVSTPLQARFEIEMGRCGVFLTSYITPLAIYQDLAALFRRNCPTGVVIYLAGRPDESIPDADIVISEADDPHSIVMRVRSKQSGRESRESSAQATESSEPKKTSYEVDR
jgi:hypothetical protein